LKKPTIRNGFRLTGIVPFKPNIVLKEIPQAIQREETPSASSASSSVVGTPKTTEKFQRIVQDIYQARRRDSRYKTKLNQLLKGAKAVARYAKVLEDRLDIMTEFARQRALRAMVPKRRIQTGGIVSSKDMRRMKRKTKKVSKEAEIKRWKALYKKCMPEVKEECKQRGIIAYSRRAARRVAEN
jgi:hypothetical protein